MKCENCGAELLDTARACDVCGKPVTRKELSLMDFYEEVPADEDGGVGVYFVPPDESFAPEYYRGGGSRRSQELWGTILKVSIVVLVISLGVLAFAVARNYLPGAANETAAESTEKPKEKKKVAPKPKLTQVTLPIEVAGEGLGDEGSRIPVFVRKAETNDVENPDEIIKFVRGDGTGLGLEAGDYVVRIAGTPISGQGVLYWYPETEFRVHVPGEEGAEYAVEEVEPAVLNERYNGEVSEDQIAEARSWIEQDTEKAASAEVLAQRARERYVGVA